MTPIEHYEAVLKAAFPDGASGEVLEHWSAARSAQPAPSVPDKVEVREDKEGEIFSRGSYNEGYDNGWNDCIDAMLAAARERRTSHD